MSKHLYNSKFLRLDRTFLLLIFVFEMLNFANAIDVPHGIPEPFWGGLDPTEAEPPGVPAEWPESPVEGFYYVDNTHPYATNDNNPYGFPNKPRLEIPEVPFPAGSYLQIQGGPYEIKSGDKQLDLLFSGTSEEPCWVVGVGLNEDTWPELRGKISIAGDYCIIKNLSFRNGDLSGKNVGISIGYKDGVGNYPASYICLKECDIVGTGEFRDGFSAGINIIGFENQETHNIVIYNCEIKELGNVQYSIEVAEDDDHGIIPGQYTNHVWILENNIHHCAGDGIQVSGNNAFGEARSEYVYIGGNTIHSCGENALDIKSSLDVIISGNEFYNFLPSKGSDGTVIVLQQEGGGGCERIWVLFNEIYDSSLALRSEELITYCYVLGNLLYNLRGKYASDYTRTNNASLSLIDNTIVNYEFAAIRTDNSPTLEFSGNVLFSRKNLDGFEIRLGSASDIANIVKINNNAYDDSKGFRARIAGFVYESFDSWKISNPVGFDRDSVYGPLGFKNPQQNDYSLTAGSIAIGQGQEHPAYNLFQQLYGLNIRYDFAGNSRPQGGSWDIGALEYQENFEEIPPQAPTNLNILK